MLDDARGNRLFIGLLTTELATRRNRTVLLFDALDEAHHPEAIAEFVDVLASSTSTLPIWTIVSSRWVGSSALGLEWSKIDLDSESFTDFELAAYVREKLLQSPGSPFAGSPELAAEVADLIAQKSGNSILLTSMLVNRALAWEGTPSAGHPHPLDLNAPSDVIGLIRESVGRLGPDENDAKAILKVLAESDRSMTARELIEAGSRRGTHLIDSDHLTRIMSGLPSLILVTRGSEPEEEAFQFVHEAIRDAFLADVL
jgi:hypothetical protein